MPISSEQKRLDKLEIYLTPKELAIQLAQEIRWHASQEDFWKDWEKREVRESPFVKPFSKLAQQAQERHPGKRSVDIDQRIQLSRKLQTEFQALRLFISLINETIKNKAETIAIKIALRVSQLQSLILEDDFSRLAKAAAVCIERTAEGNKESQSILERFRVFTNVDSASSLIELVANDLVALVTDILALETALQLAQDRYFDGHPILFRDIEYSLMETIEATKNAVKEFNAFLVREDRADLEATKKKPGLIDIEQMMNSAREVATMNVLRQGGMDGASLHIFHEMMEEPM